MEPEMILTGRHIAVIMGVLFVAIAAGFAVWWRMSTKLRITEDVSRKIIAELRTELENEKEKVPEIQTDSKVRWQLNTIVTGGGRAGFVWISGRFTNKEPFTYVFRAETQYPDIDRLLNNLPSTKALLTEQAQVYLDGNGHAPRYLWGPILLQACGFVSQEDWMPTIPGSELNDMLPPEIRAAASTLIASEKTRMGVPLHGIKLPPLSRAASTPQE